MRNLWNVLDRRGAGAGERRGRGPTSRRRIRACTSAVCLVVAISRSPAAAQTNEELRRLTLEQLLSVELTTVSRTPETAARTPAAVTVITQDDIRRSGATSLAEALRLAPGVHVARIDGNKWAIGVRGFTDRLARGLLVMIDGRAVYSPLFAGTYWEVQDTLLEDIERIEVVRGPGGTLWGANAVNGIVNIVTKTAWATQGGLLTAGGGVQERAFLGARVGLGTDRFAYRIYGKLFDRGPGYHRTGTDFDDWAMGQAGFRSEWAPADGRTVTLQGDLYSGEAGQHIVATTYAPPFGRELDDRSHLSGGNLLARWTTRRSPGSGVTLQAYIDRTHRREATFEETRHTADLDLQVNARPGDRHRVVWGLGYRVTADDTRSVPIREFVPASRTDQLFSAFAQDHVSLSDRVDLILGSKIEHNNYSGVEVQPSARLLWMAARAHTLVLAATRAVRTPSRVEHDYFTGSVLDPALPLFLRLQPNDAFVPEKLIAYELGYRVRPGASVFITASAFLNHHRDVLSTRLGTTFFEATPAPPHLILPLQFGNALHGNSHGIEVTADVRFADWWRVTGSYSGLVVQLTEDAGETDLSQEQRVEGGSPRHQGRISASLDLPKQVGLDWHVRYASALPSLATPAYGTSDVRLAWRPTTRLELAVVGTNLHDAHHLEFPGGASGNVDVRRHGYAQFTWRW